MQQQPPPRLRHALNNQNAGHHRSSGKVPLKMRLVDRDILDRDDLLQPLHFQHAINHQERIAMRQIFLNFQHVKDHSVSPRGGPLLRPSDAPAKTIIIKEASAPDMRNLRAPDPKNQSEEPLPNRGAIVSMAG